MAVRDGMTDLIAELRGLTDAGTAEYTVNGEAWWSDQQLQDELDRNAVWHNDVRLTEEIDYIGNDPTYLRYKLPSQWLEGTASGTAVWRLTNSAGSTFASSAFSINHALGELTMAADQDGSAVYLTARSYKMYSAAASVWSRKASAYAGRFDVRTDNHDLKRSQLVNHARDMAKHYRNEAVQENLRMGSFTRMVRVDVN